MYQQKQSHDSQCSTKDLILHLPGATINDQELYNKKLRADIFLTLKTTNKVFPLHSFRVKAHSKWLNSHAIQKNLVIDQNFKEQDLSKVISLFYGFHIKIQRVNVAKYYHILAFLEANYLLKIIETDMRENLGEYDIFVVLQIAHRYNIEDLIDLCLRQLLNQEFQQIQYNLYDLLRCSEDVFRLVISYHNKMRLQGKTKGFSWEQIQQIIKQYSDTNKLTTIKTTQLLHTLVDHKELFFEENMKKAGANRLEDDPTTRIIASRQQQNSRTSIPRKLSESHVAQQFVVKPLLTPTKSSTFYSHIWDIQHTKEQPQSEPNLQMQKNQNFAKKKSSNNLLDEVSNNNLQSDKNLNRNQSNDQSNQQPQEDLNKKKTWKLLKNPLDGPRAVSKDSIQKKQSHQQKKISNKFSIDVDNRISTEFQRQPNDDANYLSVKVSGPSPHSTDKKNGLKVNQMKKPNKISITQQKSQQILDKQRKLSFKTPIVTQGKYLSLNAINTDNQTLKFKNSFRQSRKIEQTKSTNNLQQKNKFQAESIILKQYMSTNNDSRQLNNRMRSTTNIDNKNTKKISQNEKTVKFERKQKSKTMKQIEELNNQSQKIKLSNQKIFEQLKMMNKELQNSDAESKGYKQNLKNIEQNLRDLQKKIGQKNYIFCILQEKVSTISKSVKTNVQQL